MNKISIVYSYYKNPHMLEWQLALWREYPKSLQESFEIIVVDDGSPVGERAEEVVARVGCPVAGFRLFRVLVDLPWYQRGAHNLGLHHAMGDWLLWIDIDHLITSELLLVLLSREFDRDTHYSFERIHYLTKAAHHPHKETRFMHRELFEKLGGWDEAFCGHYAFTERAYSERIGKDYKSGIIAPPLEMVGLSPEFPDCRTKNLVRKEGRDDAAYNEIKEWKRVNGVGIQMLKLPWKEVKF